MPQNPNVKVGRKGDKFDQHPSVGNKPSGSKFDQNPNVKQMSSGSHLDQHPNVKAGNMTGDHLTPSVKAGTSVPKNPQRGGDNRVGYVKQKPATNMKAGPKHTADRIV
jgi:hypothetical protein